MSSLSLNLCGVVVVVCALVVGVAVKSGGVASPIEVAQFSLVPSNGQTESRVIADTARSEVSSYSEHGASFEAPEGPPSPGVGSPETAAPKKLLTASEIIEYLRLGDVPYSRIGKDLGQESLPILYSILGDRQYFRDWNQTATAIAYLGENQKSYRTIIEYIRRYDSWDGLPGNESVPLVLGKTAALRLLSLVGGLEGERVLKLILRDPVYAEDFLADWIKRPTLAESVASSSYCIMEARGAAALGLVLAKKDTNTGLVREAHVVALENTRRADEGLLRIPAPTEQDIAAATCENQFYNRMVHALAVEMYIQSESMASYLDAPNSEKLRRELKQLRYQIRQEDGSISADVDTGKEPRAQHR